MSQHHQLIKNDPRWKSAKRACHDRDGWACVECGATEELEADHIVRITDDWQLRFDVDNLRTLCRPCHIEKEREYETNRLIRVTWVNPRYAEINQLVGIAEPVDDSPIL